MQFRYALYLAILVVSFTAAWLLPVAETLKTISAIPGIGALFLFVNQLWRDELAHERARVLQSREQDFILGTASHMAEVAYNKHADFCEEYIRRIQEGRQELFREGPSVNAMNIGRDLMAIRQKHSPWLTMEIEESLQPFEQALIKIGVNERYLANAPIGEARSKAIDEIYKAFGLVLGHEKALNEDEANLKIDRVVQRIRDILGINTLTKLRQESADLAIKRIGESKNHDA